MKYTNVGIGGGAETAGSRGYSGRSRKEAMMGFPGGHAICYTYEHHKLGSSRITGAVNILPGVFC